MLLCQTRLRGKSFLPSRGKISRSVFVIVANLFARARPRRGGQAAGAADDRQPGGAVVFARWATCVVGLAAYAAAQRSWVEAVLTDRGAELLVVKRTGLDLAPTGQFVVAIGAVVAVLCVATSWWPRARAVVPAVPLAGLALIGLALGRLDAADPLATKISKLRIGTFQYEKPVADTAVGSGLWWCLAAGGFLVVVGLWWVVLERRRASSVVASEPASEPASATGGAVAAPGPDAAAGPTG